MERLIQHVWLLALGLTIALPAWSGEQEAPVAKKRLAIPSPVSRNAAIPADPAARRRFNEYQDTYVKSLRFLDAAEKSGIRIEKGNVDARMAVYAELYPGESFEFARVENQLKAEKYLADQGQTVSESEVDSRLSDLSAAGTTFKAENDKARRQALQSELLFKKADVLQLGEKTLELTVLRNQEIMEPSTTQWPKESLRLQGSPDECLASLEGECWVTLDEFNAVMGLSRAPRAIDLDSVRASTLRGYLLEKQFAKMEPSPGKGPLADSIVAALKTEKSRDEFYFRTQGMGRLAQDPKNLWATYDRYYRELFKARMEAVVDIIGSSDSAYLDSLHHILKGWKKTVADTSVNPPEEPSLPWLSFHEKNLPRDLSVHTDTLNTGEFTEPFKTGLGFYLAKVRDMKWKKEVTFEAAIPRLIYLATREKFLRMDSVIDAKSLKYYQKHAEEFRIPDTLALTAWLVPFRREGKKSGRNPLLLSRHPGKDTLDFTPVKISSLLLPRKLQGRLSALMREKPTKGGKKPGNRFIGPLKWEYGQWYFRIDQARMSEGILPYAVVKKEIIKRLVNPETEPEPMAGDSTRDEVLLTLGLAEMHKSRERLKWQNLPTDEIERMIEAGEVDTNEFAKGMSKDKAFRLYRLSLENKHYIKDLDEKSKVVKRVEIDFARLFKR